MVVVVRSSPDTPDGKRGVKLARDMAADLVLLQNGVYFAEKEWLEGFCGTAFLLEEDRKLRGLKDSEIGKDIVRLDYDGLIDLMAREDKVIGMF